MTLELTDEEWLIIESALWSRVISAGAEADWPGKLSDETRQSYGSAAQRARELAERIRAQRSASQKPA